MKIIDTDQRSDRWHSLRMGRPTASQFDRIVLPNGKASGKARGYLYELLWQRLTGQSTDRDLSRVPAVQWGIQHEDEAAQQFEAIEGKRLKRTGHLISTPSLAPSMTRSGLQPRRRSSRAPMRASRSSARRGRP